MRKLLSIVIAIVIVVILLGAGAVGYLWYSTKQEMDRIVTEAKPFAEISYGGIEISPAGSVGVSRLRIRPMVLDDSISIGAVRLNTPNFLTLLNVRWQLSQNQLPESLALSFHDFELSLSGGILGVDPGGHADESSPFDHLDALGCGPITAFGAPNGGKWATTDSSATWKSAIASIPRTTCWSCAWTATCETGQR